LQGALAEPDVLELFESLLWRLVAAGSTIERASLHIGTLHPELFGFSWVWNRTDGLCDEIKAGQAALLSDFYRRNPLFQVIERGERIQIDTRDRAAADRYPLVKELAAAGITEYIAAPLVTGDAYHNAVTVATKGLTGFSDSERTALTPVFRLLALHAERHIAARNARNALDTYLGHAVGAAVLSGTIKRGSGRRIRSVIWLSDLRGFTELSDHHSGEDVTALLNAYFECLVTAIAEQGGEVLKFIGDGLLAVFSYSDGATGRVAAESALAAARMALEALDRLNASPPEALLQTEGWRPLRTGIALHAGEVFFGNIGSVGRLDFTVIGRAVNEASRVESLTKTLGRPLLITGAVAHLLSGPLDDLGRHTLRGRAEPIRLFSPR
jgi:adenylate cyclase